VVARMQAAACMRGLCRYDLLERCSGGMYESSRYVSGGVALRFFCGMALRMYDVLCLYRGMERPLALIRIRDPNELQVLRIGLSSPTAELVP